MTKKNKTKATAAPTPGKIEVRREGGKIWSHVRQKWLVETPEETVRQEFLRVLTGEYGFALEQIAEEEEVTGRGSGHARADFVVWRTVQDKADGRNPLIVVECKSDNVTIRPEDYCQGDNYARLTGARFFVTHNSRETKFWRVLHDRMPKDLEEIEDIPHADATDKEIEKLLEKLKAFKEDEFADLLHQCHNIIRNREKLDPAAAFDEIAKILFIKVDVERRLRRGSTHKNLFTAEFLDQQHEIRDDPVNGLFDQTKEDYEDDRIFDKDETVNLRFNTAREIVRKLERYNLSATSEDIKGIAFERFLGKTFRGEIGQFFTPRPIVEFMVRMVDPKPGDVVCDPASGSGGFLIRFFEIVREQILSAADRDYRVYKKRIEQDHKLSVSKKAESLRIKWEQVRDSLRPDNERGSLWYLANACIYGTDANDRMARTSKMNMIMHGDGHGGVHHHDGFLNVNGIFEGRFDIILTNPPFGANVEPSDVVLEEQVTPPPEQERRYIEEFGDAYRQAQARVRAAKGDAIASLFELPTGRGNSKVGKVKTEILFIERCLSLLKPGGRMGIVLPEGVFNNPSLAYVREFCEDRARILAVVSLPQETFYSSGATVKASLLFMHKFTQKEKADFDRKKAAAEKETRAKYAPRVKAETVRLEAEIEAAKKAKDAKDRKELEAQLRQFQRDAEDRIQAETRALLKARWPYPIFLYDAEKVGIAATGEPDANELYPNPNTPPGLTQTALELYHDFRKDPQAFLKGLKA
jgi:type I restriction enzyme M protein